ncbi:hypothetical protein CONLIGDRAFT_656648 [Coniochaeta ligniaria NRRL 30616]|uniref:Uncharacterized protein n=1 Tax=Coniochaeta ligniaria NRRL 30616 TaxID=1408157 RepID=A0A1J7IF87_9PEZI|nr:hypothetical protein CONLIGDRAFT_656648 [Coniochaeta ligniaria NRRL 30616]
MDPLSITASLIAIIQLTSTLLEYLNSVKDAPKGRAQCAIEASNLYNLLTVLRYRMEESSSNEPWFNALKALGIHHGPLDQYRHALEQILEKTSGSSSARKLGSSLLWPFKKEDVKDLLVRIERLKTVISIALEMDHFKLSQAIKADMRTIQDGTEGIKVDTETIRKALPVLENKLDRIRDTHQGDRLSEISEWISSANFGPQHADFITGKQDGTGVWFLESPAFVAWLQGSSETLFCPGIPGAGKTMIAAITVDHLLRTMQSDSIGVAFVYCNYKNDVDLTATGFLASILKQLLSSQTAIPDQITGMYHRHRDRGTDPTLEDISTALLSVLDMYSRTYIVIDALDECPENKGARTQLIKIIRMLQAKANVCSMFTSRFLPDIQSEFASVLTLEITANDSDVQRFLEGQIHRLPKCIQRDEEMQTLVKTRIAKAVDGM